MRSRQKWAGHMDRIEEELLTKRADALRVEGRMGRASHRLCWEDCGSGRMRARDMGSGE